MDLNASIIDQRVTKLMEEIRSPVRERLNISDDPRLKSLAFVYLCVKELLDLDADEVMDCLTEGGGDFGVDALHISEVVDGEFGVTLFQGKYKNSLQGDSNFPLKGLNDLILAVRHIFDPSSSLGAINERLQSRVEEVRSLIGDGLFPRVRAVCCNIGVRWVSDGDTAIERAEFGSKVTWEHVNQEALVNLMQRTRKVDVNLRLSGRAIVEDLSFSRICVGRIPVAELSDLMATHGDRLLERNIRRYLGLVGNRVNEGIRETLMSPNAADFYLLNNGITLVCDDFSYNSFQQSDYIVKVKNLQIVNGGQTCMTIFRTSQRASLPPEATVMVRLYKLPIDKDDLALRITHATNSQNPVDIKDLRANDRVQQLLETGMQGLGFNYRRKRMETPVGTKDVTSGTVAESVLAVWRREPHRARFFAREHFGKLYDTIFSRDLNAAQAITAVLLFRIAENHRRRPADADPPLVRYASCFLAMQMGKRLLRGLALQTITGLDHRNFNQARELIESNGEAWFGESCADVERALQKLYGGSDISLQQLSATFRRGDLIHHLTVQGMR
jgi:hypothetical protein